MRNRSDGTRTKAAADAAAFPNPSDAEPPLREPPHGALCRSSDLQIPVDAATTAPAPPSRAGCYRPPVTCFRRKDSRSLCSQQRKPRGEISPPQGTVSGIYTRFPCSAERPSVSPVKRDRAGATKSPQFTFPTYYNTREVAAQGPDAICGPALRKIFSGAARPGANASFALPLRGTCASLKSRRQNHRPSRWFFYARKRAKPARGLVLSFV